MTEMNASQTGLGLEESILGFFNTELDHKRGVNYGLPMTSFYEALSAVALYLCFVSIGSRVMKKRVDVVSLRYVQYVYNLLQVGLCGWLVVATWLEASELGYSFSMCNSCSDMEKADGRMPLLLYVFYLSKLLDFLDTVFIIMHKKDKQLSFLHLYHHCTIFSIYWINANVNYQGNIWYTIVANGAVHTVMYAYYFVSMLKDNVPALKPILAASRPFITSMQLVQFVTMQAQAAYFFAACANEGLNRLIAMYLAYIFSLFVLFMQFAIKNYCRRTPNKGKAKKSE